MNLIGDGTRGRAVRAPGHLAVDLEAEEFGSVAGVRVGGGGGGDIDVLGGWLANGVGFGDRGVGHVGSPAGGGCGGEDVAPQGQVGGGLNGVGDVPRGGVARELELELVADDLGGEGIGVKYGGVKGVG